MRKLLLASVCLFAAVATARADAIILQATVDGSVVSTLTSANGNLDVNAQSFGPIYNINSLSINSQTFLAPPDILSTNTLDVNQNTTGNHQLIIDIIATGLSGPNSLQAILSSFSVTGLTQPSLTSPLGWSAREQTFINGNLLADTGVFTQTSDSAFAIDPAFLGSTYNAEVRYTIQSSGIGRFNGGIDLSVAAVPGPVVGAGLPGLLSALGFGGFGWWKRRSRKVVVA